MVKFSVMSRPKELIAEEITEANQGVVNGDYCETGKRRDYIISDTEGRQWICPKEHFEDYYYVIWTLDDDTIH